VLGHPSNSLSISPIELRAGPCHSSASPTSTYPRARSFTPHTSSLPYIFIPKLFFNMVAVRLLPLAAAVALSVSVNARPLYTEVCFTRDEIPFDLVNLHLGSKSSLIRI
jgi:hypothetical protein